MYTPVDAAERREGGKVGWETKEEGKTGKEKGRRERREGKLVSTMHEGRAEGAKIGREKESRKGRMGEKKEGKVC